MLNKKIATKDFYEERYKNGYMEGYWTVEKKERIREIVKNLNLPDQGIALDFGCGDGTITEIIRTSLPQGWAVDGMDISSVAIKKAKDQYPNCNFYVMEDKNINDRKYDFLFTHHVLEHVNDLASVSEKIANLLTPDGSMLHILPCGNKGSFEHQICSLRIDGIDPSQENRFFFEEPGHIRRLDTQQMKSLFSGKGITLIKEYYSNQFYGAIAWIVKAGPRFVWKLTDPLLALNEDCKKRLGNIRFSLFPLSLLFFLTDGVELRLSERKKTLRNYLFIIGLLIPYILVKPVEFLVDSYLDNKRRQEWLMRKTEPNGSEMYLVFSKLGNRV